MKVIKNRLSEIPKMPCDVDGLKDLPFIPADPLPKKSFAFFLVGAPATGKTNLLISLLSSKPTKKSKKPKYYYGLFDRIELISGSLSTLPSSFKKKLPENQLHDEYSDELIMYLLDDMKNGEENTNNAIIIDDCIRDINNSKILSKVFLNRRHITYDENKDKKGGLSIFLTSQKYNLCPLTFRSAMSDIILFRSSNNAEISAIRDELMYDLSRELADEIMEYCWNAPYSFLYIKMNKPREEKYFRNFDKIIL